jgi:hypothetical protein
MGAFLNEGRLPAAMSLPAFTHVWVVNLTVAPGATRTLESTIKPLAILIFTFQKALEANRLKLLDDFLNRLTCAFASFIVFMVDLLPGAGFETGGHDAHNILSELERRACCLSS